MALKMKILGGNVTTALSSGYTVNQKLPAATLLELVGAGTKLSAGVNFECPINQSGTGYMGVEVFDKDNNSVLEVSAKGKLGKEVEDNLGYKRSSITVNVAIGNADAIGEITEVYPALYQADVTLAPANFSTGKLRLMYSGKLPNFQAFGLGVAVIGQAPNTLGYVSGAQGMSGHAEMNIEFEVVDE